jgi:hypothetical protein
MQLSTSNYRLHSHGSSWNSLLEYYLLFTPYSIFTIRKTNKLPPPLETYHQQHTICWTTTKMQPKLEIAIRCISHRTIEKVCTQISKPLMSLLMRNEQCSGHKGLITEQTQIGPITSMRSFVNNQRRTLRERLLTTVARKWSFPCVGTLMDLQIPTRAECLPTHMTHIRFLTSVGTNMHFQIVSAWQYFATNITDTLAIPCMGFHVNQ